MRVSSDVALAIGICTGRARRRVVNDMRVATIIVLSSVLTHLLTCPLVRIE